MTDPMHMPSPYERWMARSNLETIRVEGVDHAVVAARLRANGYHVVARMVEQEFSAAERDRLKAERDALLAALKRAMPWLRKALADGLNDNSAAPMALPRCIEQAEDVIARVEASQ